MISVRAESKVTKILSDYVSKQSIVEVQRAVVEFSTIHLVHTKVEV